MRASLLFVCLLLCATARAQQEYPEDDPLSGQVPVTDGMPLESDPELFLLPLEASRDVFSRFSQFNFSAVRYSRRGLGTAAQRFFIDRLDLTQLPGGDVNYALAGALRYTPLQAAYGKGMEWAGGSLRYSAGLSRVATGGRVSLSASDRTARAGLRASWSGALRDSTMLSFGVSRRWGRDPYVGGLFLDETMVSAAVGRRTRYGEVTLLAVVPFSERPARTAATQEAFELTGDPLYNPSWGLCDGRERSARVRKSVLPTVVATWSYGVLHGAVSCTAGRTGYSGLAWFESRNPLPDYYRSMPSAIADRTLSDEVAGLWRSGDRRVTQVDWDEMVRQNLVGDGRTVYMVADDARRVTDLQAVAGVTLRPAARFTIDGGIRLRSGRERNSGRASDLLGSEYFADVDRYNEMSLNDVRNPDRIVREGGEFGYNYRAVRSETGVYGALDYGDRRLTVCAALDISRVTLLREGLYEKQSCPDGTSYGRSKKYPFTAYAARLTAGYAPGPQHWVGAGVSAGGVPPALADLFLSPRYSNGAVSLPDAMQVAAAEASYVFTAWPLKAKLSGFYVHTSRETDVRRYYDDISSTYADMVMSDVEKEYYGVELGAEVVLSPRLTLCGAFSAASYRYPADPRIDLYSDADGSALLPDGRSLLTGCRTGLAPETVAGLELRFNGLHGWFATATLSHMAGSYVTPDPVRRMARSQDYAPSAEARAAMSHQERFDAATVAGLFVCKSFFWDGKTLTALASVSNLLDRRDIVYSGYEQMRMLHTENDTEVTYAPFASKYLYSHGRRWYVSVIYRF